MPGVISQKTRVTRLASKISKLQIQQSAKNDATEKSTTPLTARTSSIEVILTSRKRKVEDDAASTAKKIRREPEEQRVAPATPTSRKQKTVRFAELEAAPSTLSTNRKRRFESDETTQAEALLERLNIQSSPVSKRNKTTTDRRSPRNEYDLPKELNDLLDLHEAFLKTLSLQYAHNGSISPIDLRTLYPSVTRTWGKRHVMLDDIQRCVGVLTWTPFKNDDKHANAPFFLADYGRGKICVEFHPTTEPGPLREPKLNMEFEANLRTLWLNRCDEGQPAALFIGTLPKAAIKSCVSLAKSRIPSKAQSTLDDFKNSLALKKQHQQQQEKQQQQQEKENKPPTPSEEEAPKLSLLERIRLREQQRSSSTPGPSASELQRRAALNRAADVSAVIGMLCKATASSNQARVSFTMAAVLQRLKDSMRVPISQEDGAACVRLIAKEVAPQWLRVVMVGGRENVIVQVGCQPGKGELEGRVGVLLG